MEATLTIYLNIHVDCLDCSSEQLEMDDGRPFPNVLDVSLAELHFFTVLHLVDYGLRFQFYRRVTPPGSGYK